MPAVERFLAEDGWHTALVVAHGAVNRAILSWALTGERSFLGRFEQAPCCVNVLDVTHGGEPDWIVRAVNVAASDLAHRSTRQTTMEQYWAQYRREADRERGADAPTPPRPRVPAARRRRARRT